MKFLHKLQSEDELKKNYYGYESEVTSIVVGGKTYNYSHLEENFYIWVNPNDSSDWVDSDVKRNPAAGDVAYILGSTKTTIDSVVSEPLPGRDIPYDQPWASWIPGVGVNYNKYHCNFNGWDYVDLGLPSQTLWATCNIGASTPTSVGGYYAWGEISTKSDYSWNTYRFGTENNLTKYNNSDGLVTLELQDDVANVVMGGDWHIPTNAQIAEFYHYMTALGTGEYVSSINGNTISFPIGENIGRMDGTSLILNNYQYFWSNNRSGVNMAWHFSDEGESISSRYYGFQVRACIDGSALKSPITDGSFPIQDPAT